MHEAITIITCLGGATTEEFCSVATFSDTKHSVVVNLVSRIGKPIKNHTTVMREVAEGVHFMYVLHLLEILRISSRVGGE